MSVTPADVEALVILGSLAVGYTACHFAYHSPRLAAWFAARLPHERSEIARHLLCRTIQVLGMAEVPGLLLRLLARRRLADYGVVIRWEPAYALTIAALCVAVVAVVALNPRKARLTAQYP